MPNMQNEKTAMRELDPQYRARCFEEVACGYTAEEALNEAARCLNCKNAPCMKGCPVGVRIPEFIAELAKGNVNAARDVIKTTNALPAVCGRVCPQESQCESRCVRGIKGQSVAIGRLERYAADNADDIPPVKPEPNGHRVAVVGAGPAGLTCAGALAARGVSVTVFEAFHTAGGVLVYGIPEFRLPKAIVKKEIDNLEALGVEIRLDCVVGRTKTVDELFEEGYEAVFIGTGAGLPSFMNIPGENLNGVYSANELLTRVNLMKAYLPEYDTPVKRFKNVAVVGGGNVAMDAARCSMRLGAEKVYIVYRRGESELPARAEEIHHAKEEGIDFKLLCSPVEILGDESGAVKAVRCIEMELGEPDASGRRRPVEKKGSEFEIEVDAVVMSIGTSPNPLIRMTTGGIIFTPKGCISADEETGKTSRDGVYAGGDAVTGAATVILAMGAGKRAAEAIFDEITRKD